MKAHRPFFRTNVCAMLHVIKAQQELSREYHAVIYIHINVFIKHLRICERQRTSVMHAMWCDRSCVHEARRNTFKWDVRFIHLDLKSSNNVVVWYHFCLPFPHKRWGHFTDKERIWILMWDYREKKAFLWNTLLKVKRRNISPLGSGVWHREEVWYTSEELCKTHVYTHIGEVPMQ